MEKTVDQYLFTKMYKIISQTFYNIWLTMKDYMMGILHLTHL